MSERLEFPKGFLWGAATASYQVEGGIENCDWAQAGRDGKVPVCGRACDHYNRYEEDFDIAKSLGHTTHRFSVEWARIEPEEGKFDKTAIEHYKDVLRALKERNLEPQVTILHFTLPLWFSNAGGWERNDAPDIFARYALHVADNLAPDVQHFATLNEPMVVAGIGYIRGKWPPFRKRAFMRYLKALRAMQKGHNSAYAGIKQNHPGCQVGIVKHTVAFSANNNPWNKLRALVSNIAWTRIFMSGVYKQCDWIGLNYYQHHRYGETRPLPVTDFGWKIDAYEGTLTALHELARYHKPIYVTEAGCADAHDRFRADYIRDTARAIYRAITEGIHVRGYCYWSLLDNYEWAEGFEKRFGLVEINYDTLERRIRPSAYIYKDICDANSVEGTT